MKYRPIITNSSLQELTQHGTPEFPMSMDRMILSAKDCANIPHWHDEIQISLVTKGEITFRSQSREYRLSQGEGIFFNSRVLHEASPVHAGADEYICVNFLPELLYHHTSDMIYRDYIEPLLTTQSLDVIVLRREAWQIQLCHLLTQLAYIYDACAFGYELQVVSILQQICFLLVSHHQSDLKKSTYISLEDKQRMRALQNYIHQNYMEDLTLADIAQAAHISRGECCRIFKRVCNMTPFQYLNHHRIFQSTKLLNISNHSIAEIAGLVGFGSSSYFIQCFKKELNQTPLEYRTTHLSTNEWHNVREK